MEQASSSSIYPDYKKCNTENRKVWQLKSYVSFPDLYVYCCKTVADGVQDW